MRVWDKPVSIDLKKVGSVLRSRKGCASSQIVEGFSLEAQNGYAPPLDCLEALLGFAPPTGAEALSP